MGLVIARCDQQLVDSVMYGFSCEEANADSTTTAQQSSSTRGGGREDGNSHGLLIRGLFSLFNGGAKVKKAAALAVLPRSSFCDDESLVGDMACAKYAAWWHPLAWPCRFAALATRTFEARKIRRIREILVNLPKEGNPKTKSLPPARHP